MTCTELAISGSSGSVSDRKWCQQASFIRSRHVQFRHKNRTVPSESLHEKNQSCYSKGKKLTVLCLVGGINLSTEFRFFRWRNFTFFTNWLLVDKICQENQKLCLLSSLSHSLFLNCKWGAFQAATNSSSTRFSAVIWQLCSWPSHVSPSQDFVWEVRKLTKLFNSLTGLLEECHCGRFWTWKERTDWKKSVWGISIKR